MRRGPGRDNVGLDKARDGEYLAREVCLTSARRHVPMARANEGDRGFYPARGRKW